ncbi:hypothetical protein FUAX_00160 [Fulvitalea axinellae]|uniref:RagB/SusD domain-containing protein n=1 Tax=Fulvitalea axinellae TaxID=1182444 RepID=A0AAU9CMQ8_9BACT|nr:hypothetical protein FUAX_00160 [Fulvitalea axinellae]
MKRVNYILMALAFAFSGCFSDLDPISKSDLSPDQFFKTEKDVKAAVSGVYAHLENLHHAYGGSNLNPCYATTDEFTCSWGDSRWRIWRDLTWTPTTGDVTKFYNLNKITEATNMIFRAEAVDMDPDLKDRYIAEMRMVRAILAWYQYRFYGPVPVILEQGHGSDYRPERPTKEWMVDFLVSEAEACAAILPKTYDAGDFGRMTKGIAYMLELKVYMNDHQWQKAAEVSKKIMDLGVYNLQDTYASVFHIDNEMNDEIVWAISRTPSRGNHWLAHVYPYDYVSLAGNSVQRWGGFKVPWDIYDRCFTEAQDGRLEVLWSEYPINADGTMKSMRSDIGALPVKYSEDPAGAGTLHGNDWIIWRYTDVLLSRAEALNQLSGPTQEATDLINTVRSRAGVSQISKDDFTKESLNDYILDERFRELYLEGHRRDDLIRHGKFIEKAKERGVDYASEKHLLFPIPQWQLDQDPDFPQNPGY